MGCVAGAKLRAVFAKADIANIVDDIFDGPVTTPQLFNLLQVDTPPVKAGDQVVDRN